MASPSLRILVVDDDVDNARSLGELFELDGHRVAVVHSGQAAIDCFADDHFDIAFMDVMMPGKNGVESFLEIRKLKPAARVYMMTGYSVEQLIQQAIEGGAMGVLSKPLNVAKVLAALSEVKPAGVVLIAEDDADFGLELKAVVEAGGHRARLVHNGRDALETVRAGGVEVLILDLKMPLIDGVEVYATLKREGRALPTIIVTGSAQEHKDTLDALRDVRLTGILHKPFDPLALLQRLDRLAA